MNLAEKLDNLQKELRSSNCLLKENFQRLFCECMETFGLTDSGLAFIVGVCEATVIRWRVGEVAPHPILRESILDIMRFQARCKLQGL